MSRNAFDQCAREIEEAEDLRSIARMERTADDAADDAEYMANRRHAARLFAHPDCSDPEHPGCHHCNDEEQEDE